MAALIKICRISSHKINSSSFVNKVVPSRNYSLSNITCMRNCGVFNAANCIRWNTLKFYGTAANNSSSGSSSAASQLASEILASKVKESQDSSSSKRAEFEDDEKKAEEEKERTRRATKYSFFAIGVLLSGMGTVLTWRWGSPPVDEDGNVIGDELSDLPIIQQYLKRTYREMRVMNKMIVEPSRDKLLPDPLTGQYIQPPYTLVLELKDVLVHPEWSYQNGWRFKKRPHIDYLLRHCAPPLFEIVIYTAEQGMTTFPVIDKLDPNGFIWYRLFKDSTLYVDGKHIKELNSLNRDLKRVILVDWDKDAVSCSRNHLCVPRWDGSSDDKALLQLGQLLRTIAESEVDDVRDVLDYYRQFDDPLAAYQEFQKQALVLDQERQLKATEEGPQVATWTPSFLKRWN